MDLGLKGKFSIVTGGSRGIGYACAELLAKEGANVLIVGSSQGSVDKALQNLKPKYGNLVEGVALDLSSESAINTLGDPLAKADILVNNAGAIPGGGLEAVSDKTWRAAWELKVYGYINASRYALPSMMARGAGVIVNVVGIAGVAPKYDYISGSMANASLIAFTKAAGAYSSSRGVRVVGVNPGATETDRLIRLYEDRAKARFGDASRWRELLSDLPFGRPAKPEEMADLVVYLASPRASYLSGVVIDADGGAQYAK